jgi:hypothetical protein
VEALASVPVRQVVLSRHGGISACTNAAAKLASGRWLVFVDQDDLVGCDTLARMAEQETEADVLYTDEDKMAGWVRFARFVKPGFDRHYLMACNYLAHCRACRRELFWDVGACDPAFDGSQDYDLVLRMVGRGARVVHVPHLLYHWRVSLRSTALVPDSKPLAARAAWSALSRSFPDRDFESVPHQPGYYRWKLNAAHAPTGYGVRCLDGDWFVAASRRSVEIRSTPSSPPAGEPHRWTLFAPCARMSDLAADKTFLTTVPRLLDRQAATVSFRVRRDRHILSGGVNAWGGKTWIAAAKPYAGLDRCCVPCSFPNPLLFATREPLPQNILPARRRPDFGPFFHWWSKRPMALHLDAPLWLDQRRHVADDLRLTDPLRVENSRTPRKHCDYLEFLASYRPAVWRRLRPPDPGLRA